jgi:hypothetical protein
MICVFGDSLSFLIVINNELVKLSRYSEANPFWDFIWKLNELPCLIIVFESILNRFALEVVTPRLVF